MNGGSRDFQAAKMDLTVGALLGLDRATRISALILSAVVLWIYFVYPAYPTAVGKSLAAWTWNACNPVNEFVHGRFVPVAFVVMCILGVKRARDEVVKGHWMGLVILGVGLLFFLGSVRTIQPRLALIGAPFTIVGMVYYLAGFRVARHFVFPAFFWWFAIPVPGIKDALTGNLQVMITQGCYHVGMWMGMDLVNIGSTISVRGTKLDIAEGCSGIRSLMALAMIAAVYANYTQKELWKKAVLFAMALPLAIFGNFFRIFTILLIAHVGFGDFASKTYHDWSGLLLFFPITLAGLYLFDYLLNWKERRRKRVRRRVKRMGNLAETAPEL